MNLFDLIAGAVRRILPDQRFNEVVLEKSLASDMIEFARANHPKEFISVVEGKIKKGSLVASGLLFQPFTGKGHSSVIHLNLPIGYGAIGSVHSHPSGNTLPSSVDLTFFRKTPLVHFIIGYPYNVENISCYDSEGHILKYRIAP